MVLLILPFLNQFTAGSEVALYAKLKFVSIIWKQARIEEINLLANSNTVARNLPALPTLGLQACCLYPARGGAQLPGPALPLPATGTGSGAPRAIC